MVEKTAAGAVGVVAEQLAQIPGCRVLGLAGTDEIKLLKVEFGFDDVINYKGYKTVEELSDRMMQACPDGVDVYFDNVGGMISDAVMGHMNFHSRMVLCGQIALYNSKEVPMGGLAFSRYCVTAYAKYFDARIYPVQLS
jgi:NADPH-dependent curcumin reductase CurA